MILRKNRWLPSSFSSITDLPLPPSAPHISTCPPIQELSKLRSALDAARRSASLLARRRLGRIEALAAWVAQQRDDGRSGEVRVVGREVGVGTRE